MTRVSLLIALLCTLATWAWAQTRTYERIVITDTAVGLAARTLQPAGYGPMRSCEGRLEEAQVRMLDTRALAVGSTTGRLLAVGDIVGLPTPSDAASVRFAKTGSTTAVLMVECAP